MDNKKKLRLFYAAGPGDVVGTYRYWKKGEDDPSNPGLTDSGQFYDIVRDLNAEALVISFNGRKETLHDENITIMNMPRKLGKGIFYHITFLFYGLKILCQILRFKPDIAIIEMDTSHYFLWNLLSLFRIKTIISLKNTVWNRLLPLNKKQQFLNNFNLSFFKNHASAIISISKYINDQIDEWTAGKHGPIFDFGTVYQKEQFSTITPPDITKKPFQILFFGRIEKEKGVFDLLTIANRLKQEGVTDFQISICGRGSCEKALQEEIIKQSLQANCKFEGYCNREKYLAMIDKSHVFIVPTQSSFAEGRNSVAVESMLSGRPLVAAESSNALDVVKEATCEARVDDIESYVEALLKLYRDKNLYKEKQSHCAKIAVPFFDIENSWKAAVKRAINSIS